MAFSFFSGSDPALLASEDTLPGRSEAMAVAVLHHANGHPITGPWPEGLDTAVFAMGCFWGAERAFWQTPGVYSTAVGYSGGQTPNPTYQEVCSGRTNHTEVVLVVYDPTRGHLSGAAQGVLGEPRSDPGHAPGQRHGHPVPLG